jgi:hypothetical protein
MRRDRFHVRATSGFVVAVAVSALILASCGTTTTPVAVRPLVTGTPARSISVPLSNVGCTLNDVCVAVGTSSVNANPDAVAEFATPKGNWIDLDTPTATSPLIDAVACSGAQCLLGGSEPGHDLLWLFQAIGHSLTSVTAPAGGIGIDALTCDLDDCALIDTGDQGGPPRFMESSDGGATWGTPEAIDFAVGDAVTAFSCGTAASCAIGVLSATHDFSLYVTEDAGATWNIETTPSAWTTLTSLSCAKRHCVALAQVGKASALVRSATFTRTWTSLDLPDQAASLSCTPTATCLLAGQSSAGTPWLAFEHHRSVTTLRLRYVPTPIIGAACGSQVCAAIGVTTLLSLPSRF